jgi:hypothetical protein
VNAETSKPVSQVLWDRDGQRLFYSYVREGADTSAVTLELDELLLPALQDVNLLALSLDDEAIDDATLRLGVDGNIYVCGFRYAVLTDGTQYKTNFQTFGSFDPKTAEYKDIPKPGEFRTEYYQPQQVKPVTSEGYGITNLMVDDRDNPRFELFQVLSQGEEKPEYSQLTDFGAPLAGINLKAIPSDFLVSPDGNRLAYSYHYYSEDPNTDLGYTLISSSDGSQKLFLTDVFSVTLDNLFAWTSDSRLLFTANQNDAKSVRLCLADQDWTVKTLKEFPMPDVPNVYYRYK